MGKLKNNKAKAKRQSPLPTPSAAELATANGATQAVGGVEGEILDIVLKLKQSEDKNARVYACGSLAYIISQAESSNKIFPALVQNGSLNILVSLLCDDDNDIRCEATGCLRNWGMQGGPDGIASLENAGVFKTLRSGLERTIRVCSGLISGDVSVEAEKLLLALENGLNLLLTLCESSDHAAKQFENSSYLDLLLHILTVPQTLSSSTQSEVPMHIQLLVCQCLYTISEDNKSLVEALSQKPEIMSMILSTSERTFVLDENTLSKTGMQMCLLSVVCTGIVYNVRQCQTTVADSFNKNVLQSISGLLKTDMMAMITSVMPMLARVSEIDGDSVALTQFARSLNADTKTTPEEQRKLEQEKAAFDAVETVRLSLTAQRMALEIYSNILSEEYDDEENSDAEMEEWEDMDGDTIVENGDSSAPRISASGNCSGSNSCDAALQAILLERCIPCPAHIRQVLSSSVLGSELYFSYVLTQCRAIGALNNLCLADKPSTSPRYTLSPAELWKMLSLALFMGNGEDDLVEVTIGTMWTVLRSNQNSEMTAVSSLESINAERICTHAANQDENIRINVAGLIGCLGQRVSPNHRDTHNVFLITLNRLLNDSSPAVIAETLNSLYDAYAEPDYNAEMIAVGLVPRLRSVATSVKRKLQISRAKLPKDVKGRLSDALYNLPRFIEYKSGQVFNIGTLQSL
eukprot:CFRG1305T1